METIINSVSHDYLVRGFVVVQDVGIKALIHVSKAKVSVEDQNKLILITVPVAWQSIAIALTNLKSLICIPIELKGFAVEIAMAED